MGLTIEISSTEDMCRLMCDNDLPMKRKEKNMTVEQMKKHYIQCEGMMYADCDKVSFATENRIGNFIRTAREDEMAKIDEGIAKYLGIEQEKIVVEKRSEPDEEVFPQEPFTKPLVTIEEFVKAQTEAETYKDLYNQLLSKVLSGQQS